MCVSIFIKGIKMYYNGIDPSWTGKYNTALVKCDNNLKIIHSCYTHDLKEIIGAILNTLLLCADKILLMKRCTPPLPSTLGVYNIFIMFTNII